MSSHVIKTSRHVFFCFGFNIYQEGLQFGAGTVSDLAREPSMLSGRTAELAYLKSALSHTEQRKVKTNVRGSLHGLSFLYTIHWLFTCYSLCLLLSHCSSHLKRIGADKLRLRTSMALIRSFIWHSLTELSTESCQNPLIFFGPRTLWSFWSGSCPKKMHLAGLPHTLHMPFERDSQFMWDVSDFRAVRFFSVPFSRHTIFRFVHLLVCSTKHYECCRMVAFAHGHNMSTED